MWLAFRALTSIDDAAWRHRPSRWHYLSIFRQRTVPLLMITWLTSDGGFTGCIGPFVPPLIVGLTFSPDRHKVAAQLHKAPSVKPRGLSPGLFQVSETECTWGTSE